jgi:predicted ABC-type ATPase
VPRLLLFAGPNGSGKSTLTTPATLNAFDIPLNRYINADEIARELARTTPDIPQETREQEAFRRARTLRVAYREGGISFAFETVFSHPSTLLDMQKCQQAGFDVVVLFVTTSNVAINVARVARRFQSGGHNVPEDRIRQRYARTMALLPRIIEQADRAFVYDNSTASARVFPFHQGIAEPTRDRLPSYLRRALTIPLRERRAEREVFPAALPCPNEADGTYTGKFVTAQTHYAVQETDTGTIRHDLSLFATVPTQDETPVLVLYRDAVATLNKP